MPEAHNERARQVGRVVRMGPVGGSDAHSLAHVARAFTRVPDRPDQAGVPRGPARAGLCVPAGRSGSYARLTSEVTRIFAAGYAETWGELRRGAAHPLRLAASAVLVPLLPLVPLVHARDPRARARVRPAPLPCVPGGVRLAGADAGGGLPSARRRRRGGRVSVLGQVLASDDRLLGRVLEWKAPRWVRLWMITATRLGDGWVWLAAAPLLLAAGGRGVRALGAGVVSAVIANALLVCVKRRGGAPGRASACLSPSWDVSPLGWFPSDRFSFPSGHALDAFAIGSVLALSFPAAAALILLVAASVAASRVVLGLHWLSDVVAGVVVGLVIGTLVWLALLC